MHNACKCICAYINNHLILPHVPIESQDRTVKPNSVVFGIKGTNHTSQSNSMVSPGATAMPVCAKVPDASLTRKGTCRAFCSVLYSKK